MPLDLKQSLKSLYRPSASEIAIVDVPELPFLMVDGAGDPNTAPAYAEAVEALYSVSYALKFLLKRAPTALDYTVMPLEGLWWADTPEEFLQLNKAAWQWTMMIVQPDVVTNELVHDVISQVGRKKALPALSKVRLERFHERRAVQVMHIGPYAAEHPTIERLHQFMADHGFTFRGKHHEIYLSDPRRAKPDTMKTILRQPIQE